jgi:hypothetical protein
VHRYNLGCLYGVAAALILRSAGAHGLLAAFMAAITEGMAGGASSIASFAAHALTLLSG